MDEETLLAEDKKERTWPNSKDTILYLSGRPMAGIKYGVPRIPITE
jgi:hypothetical protein